MSSLCGRQLLEVLQRKNFAIFVAHADEYFLQSLLTFRSQKLSLRSGETSRKLFCNGYGRRIRHVFGTGKPHFLVSVSLLSGKMIAMNFRQPLPGQFSHPDKERHGRILCVVAELIGQIDEGLLQHVRRIDATLHTPIQTHLDHHSQAVTVKLKQFG